MADFEKTDIAIGGAQGYIEIYRPPATHVQELDALDDVGNRMRVNGLTASPQLVLFAALGDPAGAADWDPHDVVWMPNGSGVLTILARSDNTAALRLYHPTTHAVLRTWTGLTLDAGWTRDKMLKIDILCDSRTVFYTCRGKKIRRFDLEAAGGTGAMLPDFAEIQPSEEPLIMAAFKIIRQGTEVIVAQTFSGNGPRNAVVLQVDRKHHWVDEINPPDNIYQIHQRDNATHVATGVEHTVQLTPTASDEILSMASFANPCGRGRRAWISNLN